MKEVYLGTSAETKLPGKREALNYPGKIAKDDKKGGKRGSREVKKRERGGTK